MTFVVVLDESVLVEVVTASLGVVAVDLIVLIVGTVETSPTVVVGADVTE